MKKVMCINDEGWWEQESGTQKEGPKYGEICTVRQEKPDYYRLDEYAFSPINGHPDWWWAECFIPLSDIDECNIASERQVKEKVCEF